MSTPMRIKAIPTTYKGITFRSKLEAAWAEWLDGMGIAWEYEPEGIDLGDLWYLPDFWLPDCRTILEVKGVWAQLDLTKMAGLWTVATPAGITAAVGERKDDGMVLGLLRPTPADIEFGLLGDDYLAWIDYNSTVVAKCRKCKKRFFMSDEGSYRCIACGALDGDHHLIDWQVFPAGVGRPDRFLPVAANTIRRVEFETATGGVMP